MSKYVSFLFSGAVLLAALGMQVSAFAGPLATHPAAFFDGSVTWRGTTVFDSDYTPNSGSLEGYVDWAVFGPGAFPAGYVGYTPTPGELTYAFQVYVDDQPSHTNEPPLAAFSVALVDLANNIGTFSGDGGNGVVNGDAALTALLTPLVSADWTFAGIAPGGKSIGLAFSSPRLPFEFFGSVVDTGQSAFVIPLPSPSGVSIPEPAATMTLVALFGALGVVRRR